MMAMDLRLCRLCFCLFQNLCILCPYFADVLPISIFIGGVLLIGVSYLCVYRRRCLELAPVQVEHVDPETERLIADVLRAEGLRDIEPAYYHPENIGVRQSISERAPVSEKVQQKKMITFSNIAQRIPLDGSLRIEDTSVSFATTVDAP
jgi:hypothetical protein